MGFFSTVKNLATIANLVNGVAAFITAAMSVWMAVTAVLANFPTPLVIFLATAVAALTAIFLFFALQIYGFVTINLMSRKGQNRVMALLDNLGDGAKDLDLMTAAAIWADTLASVDIERHSYFRGLKDAINQGHLIVTYRPEGPKSGPGTRVEINSLKDFWRKRKVIR